MNELIKTPQSIVPAIARMRNELATLETLPQVANFVDRAEVVRAAARAARLGRDQQNEIGEIKIDAERKGGVLLRQMRDAGERTAGGRPSKNSGHGDLSLPSLIDLGIADDVGKARNRAKRWQLASRLPDSIYQDLVAKIRAHAEAVLTQELVLAAAKHWLREEANYSRDYVEGCTVEDLQTLIDAGYKASTIYADPPWSFKVYSGKGKMRSADRHYDTQSLDNIKALPVPQLAADDCALLLWAVMPELPGALDVISAWGFEYKTAGFVWIKPKNNASSNAALHWGMGYWTRANAEICLLATKGSPQRQAMDVHQVVMCPVSEHSRKPDEVHERIERLLLGPYLELYGRRARKNWTVWGNEITKDLFNQSVQEFGRTMNAE